MHSLPSRIGVTRHLQGCCPAMAKSSVGAADLPESPPSLASLWEDDRIIRERIRANGGKLLMWPLNAEGNPLVGQKSMAALAMNGVVMKYMARWWCPTQDRPKTPCLPTMKKQAC